MDEEFDDFKQRRPETKRLEEGFDIEPIQHVISQVVQFLMTKAIHESRKQDKFNPTILGNVSFHVEHNKITKDTRLMFDKHPRTWRTNDIIAELTNIEADMMMEKQANMDILDNPFRY